MMKMTREKIFAFFSNLVDFFLKIAQTKKNRLISLLESTFFDLFHKVDFLNWKELQTHKRA